MAIKYAHTNIVATNWRRLAQFYIDVFECRPQLPERDLSGEWIEQVTGLENVRIRGIHLQLPGYENGPTLEIFGYEPFGSDGDAPINRRGLGHLAFHVDSVQAVLTGLLAHGGRQLGKLVVKDFPGLGKLEVVYARDPEGNIVEIQNWQK